MKLWLTVFFGVLAFFVALFVIIWWNIQIYKAFGDTASLISVIVSVAALLATLATGAKKLIE